ncbi:hypothetical protein [Paenibacillus sp. UNC451MF]|uniref:hypothetical protein n=1 Tax=Paenibacillus sp. UNC451MF TaxID=1449063 RepID=UPI0004904ED0|nr:hypothetical protein [Paenibacillus sp. UNC451MF]
MSKLYWNLFDDLDCFDVGNSSACPGQWRTKDALYFNHNERAVPVLLREELKVDCYRLQAEIACPGPIGYIGLVFGAKDALNYEMVYVSPGTEETPGEIQYDPMMNGSTTWQIYNGPRYQSPAPFRRGEWVKLALDIHPSHAAVWVGDTATPQLVISNLQHGSSEGRIGVWGYLPGYIRNLSVEEIPAVAAKPSAESLKQLAEETFVTEWLVSKPYSEGGQAEEESLWIRANVEENGTLNLNRLFSSGNGLTVRAECKLILSDNIESLLTFGFSDRLRLWINDEEVYQGDWKWDPPASDGRIRPDLASVGVRWREGTNTIRAEITSTEVVFGWGMSVRTGLNSRLLKTT